MAEQMEPAAGDSEQTGKPTRTRETEVTATASPSGKGLALMMDIPLEVTVELGKATMTLAEVLALGPGSVIELDRLPGEPLELLANGRLMARGEVVVLNETFGLRITEIVAAEGRRE